MDKRLLKEDRQHGTPGFPVGYYQQRRTAQAGILDFHWHEEFEFLRVTEGRAVFQIGLAAYEVSAGEALFIPGGLLHGGYPLHGSDCAYEALVLDLGWLDGGAADNISARYLRPLQRGHAGIAAHWTPGTPWGEAAVSALAAIQRLELAPDPARELRVKAGLLALFADLIDAGQWQARSPTGEGENLAAEGLKQALSYMETNFARKLSLRELAGVAGMSEGHFSRMFKAYMRKTPIEYLNRYRIRYAAGRLASTDLTVSEAALEAGFDNFSYFIKLFRGVYGCTPKAYRKQAAAAALG
ncbi:AraC family transcriptional regulator [Cohnella sp. JJ-181]|uniref:AraC family transcriptional regulator n=1 Tax=Cohnella rhizoplanae TaxID=2974897 RepID=UPI0022FF578C|nr:AraC family transcriptional regulator [Cohnella sp. JJ-181]CAI6056027.1 HTH-type transcriptional regulator ChbR [Cohnella sp. JJ-181]